MVSWLRWSAGGEVRTRGLLRERISYRDPVVQTILSPPPLTRLGYSRTSMCPVFFERLLEALLNSLMMFEIVVGRAGFEPATFDSDESVTQSDSRCKRDIIAGLD